MPYSCKYSICTWSVSAYGTWSVSAYGTWSVSTNRDTSSYSSHKAIFHNSRDYHDTFPGTAQDTFPGTTHYTFPGTPRSDRHSHKYDTSDDRLANTRNGKGNPTNTKLDSMKLGIRRTPRALPSRFHRFRSSQDSARVHRTVRRVATVTTFGTPRSAQRDSDVLLLSSVFSEPKIGLKLYLLPGTPLQTSVNRSRRSLCTPWLNPRWNHRENFQHVALSRSLSTKFHLCRRESLRPRPPSPLASPSRRTPAPAIHPPRSQRTVEHTAKATSPNETTSPFSTRALVGARACVQM